MSTVATFNVLTEDWIPTKSLTGAQRDLGIIQALAQAHRTSEVRDPSPIVEFSLYRLLVAFVLDALSEDGRRPGDRLDLKDLLSAGHFDEVWLQRYADACGPVFDLFDRHQPFLQSSLAGGPPKPIAAMYPAVPSGTNVGLWHHSEEAEMTAGPAEAARLLATLAPFMTAGGAGLSPSINGAPGLYALPIGGNLFETIVLNMPLRAGSGEGRVAWRETRAPGTERTQARMEEALSWRPRRVRLLPPRSADNRVSQMHFEAGDKTRFEWTDPNLAYRYSADGQTPIRMREARPLWRDAGPLALLERNTYKSQDGKVSFSRPDVVDTAFSLVQAQLLIRVYGMRTDLKMKVFEWAAGELRVPCELGKTGVVGAQIQRWLDLSDSVSRALRSSIRSLYPREGASNKTALGREADAAERRYWRALESAFSPMLQRASRLTDDAMEDERELQAVSNPWKEAMRNQARAAFDTVAAEYDSDSDAIERAVKARGRLEGAIKKILA